MTAPHNVKQKNRFPDCTEGLSPATKYTTGLFLPWVTEAVSKEQSIFSDKQQDSSGDSIACLQGSDQLKWHWAVLLIFASETERGWAETWTRGTTSLVESLTT